MNSPQSLAMRHRQELEASGIGADVISAMGCWTETDPKVLRALGFSEGQSRCVPCLVFPSHSVDGRVCYQIKPDRPFRDDDGKPVKYMTPKGGDYCLDALPTILSDVMDPARPLWVTEGSKKSACAVSHGRTTISVAGVWMWQRKDRQTGEHIPLAEWDRIPLDGRDIWLCFDSDAMSKREVHDALRELLAYLLTRGARVRIVYLPDGEDGSKTGLDDYLAAGHSVSELEDLSDTFLHALQPDLTQEIVKALQKRVKGAANITACGVTFEHTTRKKMDTVVFALRGVEANVRRVTSWAWGDLWLEVAKVVSWKERKITFASWYDQDSADKAQAAATTCRKFPHARRREGRIPFWVFREIGVLDEENQELVLDIFDSCGMTFEELRQFVSENKPKKADSDLALSTVHGICEDPEEYAREVRELLECFPFEKRIVLIRDLTAFMRDKGFDPIGEMIETAKRQKEAEEAAAVYNAHFGSKEQEITAPISPLYNREREEEASPSIKEQEVPSVCRSEPTEQPAVTEAPALRLVDTPGLFAVSTPDIPPDPPSAAARPVPMPPTPSDQQVLQHSETAPTHAAIAMDLSDLPPEMERFRNFLETVTEDPIPMRGEARNLKRFAAYHVREYLRRRQQAALDYLETGRIAFELWQEDQARRDRNTQENEWEGWEEEFPAARSASG